MIWATWRQHRAEALVVTLVLAILAALLLKTGLDMASAYHQLGVGACLAEATRDPNCNTILYTFLGDFGFAISAVGWLNALPALLGLFVGAPLLARELEHGTFRLAWTQSVPRLRWLVLKLALVLGVALLASAGLTALLTWWFSPLHQFGALYFPLTFDFEGTVPLAYAAYALTLAISAGALLRRVVPAMAVTIAGFVAARAPVELWLRPRYQPPITLTGDPGKVATMVPKTDWVLDNGWVDQMGHQVHTGAVLATCAPGQNSIDFQGAFTQCTHAHGWLMSITYQPADRFGLFRDIETAIFVALSVALVALTIWIVRRRIA
jgi:ABC-type transport system involved in multi-copper enzyme maturation permease subunit